MKKISFLTLFLLMLIPFVYGEGEPLKLTIHADKDVYQVKDPILISMNITNASSEKITVSYDRNWLFCSGWNVNGGRAEMPLPAAVKIENKTLKPGETWHETIDLNYSQNNRLLLVPSGKGAFDEPGEYKLSYANKTRIPHSKEKNPKSYALVSKGITIKVMGKKSLVNQSIIKNSLPDIIEMRIVDQNTVFVKTNGFQIIHLGKDGGWIANDYYIAAETGQVLKDPKAKPCCEVTFSVGEGYLTRWDSARPQASDKMILLKIEKGQAVFENEHRDLHEKVTKQIISVAPYKMEPVLQGQGK